MGLDNVRNARVASAVDPLDLDIRRAFVDLIRVAAPWVRRFPSARQLDDDAGAFLARPELYEAAVPIIEAAEGSNLISEIDARLLRAVIRAAERGTSRARRHVVGVSGLLRIWLLRWL